MSLTLLVLTSLMTSHCVAGRHLSEEILEVKYRTEEEKEVETYIGNVRQDTNLARFYSTDVMSSDVMSRLQFRFLHQQQQLPFSLDVTTGVIRTSGRVDRDVICPGAETCAVRLDVAVQPAQYFRLIRVTINIIDVNDNAPRFPDSTLHFEILESAVVGTGLVVPAAVDPDSPEYSVRGYRDISQSDTFDLREIRKTSSSGAAGNSELRLVLVRPLDRERIDRYRLKIMAADGGIPVRTGTVDVYIDVIDVNDNSPVFEKSSYEVTVSENVPLRTVLTRVTATDADSSLNGQIVYEFSSLTAISYGHLFAISNTSGDVFVVGNIDFEQSPVYQLIIIARDLGPESVAASVTLTVKVTDTNDNAPQISIDTLTGTPGVAVTSEAADTDTFVAHVVVTDRDAGSAGLVDCFVNDGHFRLKPMSPGRTEYQLVTAAILDRETRAVYDVGIVCRDRGVDSLDKVERLTVRVADVNDNEPRFRSPSYRAELIENNYVGAYVINVNATDPDEGENSQLAYSLVDARGFEIDPSTGVITATVSFDREVVSSYRFLVVVRDNGKPKPLSSTAEVLVDILDVNDVTPTFDRQTYSFHVDENQPVGTEVGKVTARDGDVGQFGHVTYTMTSDSFGVDVKTGRIVTTRVLDRESLPVYQLSVVAGDSAVPPLTSSAEVTIYVGDVNDNAPTFDRPAGTSPPDANATYFVSTRAPRGYVITRMRARDADIDDNGRVTFQLVDVVDRFADTGYDSTSGLFHVDRELGVVSVTGSLSSRDGCVFDVIVSAVDGGDPPLSAFTTIAIVVNSSVVDVKSSFPEGRRSVVVRHNLLVVVALAVVSGLVTVCLVVAIVCIRRGDRRTKSTSGGSSGSARKYNGRSTGFKDGNGAASSGRKKNKYDSSPQSATKYDTVDKCREQQMTSCAEPETKIRLTSEVFRTTHQPPEKARFQNSKGTFGSPRSGEVSDGCTRRTTPPPPCLSVSRKVAMNETQNSENAQQNWQVHQLLTRLKNLDVLDGVSLHSTEEGSNTDSGRGPSEPDGNDQIHTTPTTNATMKPCLVNTDGRLANHYVAHQLTTVPEDSACAVACIDRQGNHCHGNGVGAYHNNTYSGSSNNSNNNNVGCRSVGRVAVTAAPFSSRTAPKRPCRRLPNNNEPSSLSTPGGGGGLGTVELSRSPRRLDRPGGGGGPPALGAGGAAGGLVVVGGRPSRLRAVSERYDEEREMDNTSAAAAAAAADVDADDDNDTTTSSGSYALVDNGRLAPPDDLDQSFFPLGVRLTTV